MSETLTPKSETPRVEAEKFTHCGVYYQGFVVKESLALKLERDLTAANALLETMKKALEIISKERRQSGGICDEGDLIMTENALIAHKAIQR